MQPVLNWFKAAYNFISGDWIVLAFVVVAFSLVGTVLSVNSSLQLLAGMLFVGLIVLSLVVTLGRERATAQRHQRGG